MRTETSGVRCPESGVTRRSGCRWLPFVFLIGAIVGALACPLRAADDAAPSAFMAIAPADTLLRDSEYVLKLTDPEEQKQWKVLKDYLEEFLIGVDPALATRVDILFSKDDDRYVWNVPVSNFNNFRKNNIAAILTPRSTLIQPGLYRLGSSRPQDFHGLMMYVPPYVRIAASDNLSQPSLDAALKDINVSPADPRDSVKPLLDRQFILAFELHNAKTDAASQTKRRELFDGARKKTIGLLKKEPKETSADFDLRKKATEVELDEATWFFSEAQHALLGLSLDPNKGMARADVELVPIQGSPLAAAMAELGKKPSYFANIEKVADPILWVRLNHPLSEIRKKTATAFASLARDRVKSQIDSDQKRSADQKTAAKQIADKVYEMAEASIKQGIADGFAQVHKAANGKNLLVEGMRTPEGAKIVDVLNLLPKAGSGGTIKLNVAEEGGVKIHSITFSKEKHVSWINFVGADVMYVGSSKDAIWGAAGEGALDALKAAIKKTAQPAAAGSEKAPWAELIVRLKPWIEQFGSKVQVKRGEVDYEKMALAALGANDDQLLVRMTRNDTGVRGEITIQTGLLRFAGKAASQFSKENLDTPQKGPGKSAGNR